MAVLILEYAKLVPDVLTRGFVEVLSRKSPILERLPFVNINAIALSYNREELLPDRISLNVVGSHKIPKLKGVFGKQEGIVNVHGLNPRQVICFPAG